MLVSGKRLSNEMILEYIRRGDFTLTLELPSLPCSRSRLRYKLKFLLNIPKSQHASWDSMFPTPDTHPFVLPFTTNLRGSFFMLKISYILW